MVGIMERCTKAVIYKNNLEYNLNQIRKYVKKEVKLCVAVKADGYGHNAVITAQIAEKVGAAFVAVATVEEGIELRDGGIKCGILLSRWKYLLISTLYVQLKCAAFRCKRSYILRQRPCPVWPESDRAVPP